MGPAKEKAAVPTFFSWDWKVDCDALIKGGVVTLDSALRTSSGLQVYSSEHPALIPS